MLPLTIEIITRDLYWSGTRILCRKCIEEEEAFPRCEHDDPNDWELNDYGREEAKHCGLEEATLCGGDVTQERAETWFIGNYHPKFHGVGQCENHGTCCMSEGANHE